MADQSGKHSIPSRLGGRHSLESARTPSGGISRRDALRAGISLASLPALTFLAGGRSAYAATTVPLASGGELETGADLAAAEKEGSVVFYTHDSSSAAAVICEEFTKDFPKINARYVSLQTGALFSRVLSEREASRYNVDVIQFSDIGTAIDFQKKGGYQEYHSPQDVHFSEHHLSHPAGYFFWIGVEIIGISYSSQKVEEADAPADWPDLLDSKWDRKLSLKQATSGMQFLQWFVLRKKYGNEYWKEIAKLHPKAFNSRAQLFDRLARGDDSVAVLGEWAGYALAHEKKAPVKFVIPTGGMASGPVINGMVDQAPHPQAARLFSDWMRSERAQNLYQNNSYLLYGSVRKGMPPLPGGPDLSKVTLLEPTDDMDAFLASRDTFNSEWNAMLGLL